MTLKPHPQPLTVAGLIERLKGFHPERKVYVRYQDPLGESDYWAITKLDVIAGDVMDKETEKDYPAVLIGDDRV